MARNLIMGYLFFSVVLTLFFCSYVLMRAKTAYMKVFFVLCMAVSVYTFGYLMEISSPGLEQMVFWNQVQYTAIPFISALWFIFALLYTRWMPRLQWWMLAALFIIPVLTFFIRLTNASHHLFYTAMQLQQIGDDHYLYLGKGSWYYVQAAYHLFLFVGATVLFVHALWQANPLKRKCSMLLLASSFIPYAGLVLILFDFQGWGLDYVSLLFPLSLLLIVLAIARYDFLQIRSLARTQIFETSSEAFLLLDLDHHIVDYNRSAKTFFASYGLNLDMLHLESVLGQNAQLRDIIKTRTTKTFKGRDGRTFEISTRIMKDPKGNPLAFIKNMVDITEEKKIQDQLVKMATIDALSQLYNRMYFMELAEKEFARAARYHSNFSLLIMDIDKFKSVNDSRGHAAGDAVIEALGKMMRHRFRKTDLLGRIGGEEFAVLLPKTAMGEAKKLAEDFRSQVSKNNVHHDDGPISITISIGISAFAKKSKSFEEILQYADEALYQSKADGRNRVSVKEP